MRRPNRVNTSYWCPTFRLKNPEKTQAKVMMQMSPQNRTTRDRSEFPDIQESWEQEGAVPSRGVKWESTIWTHPSTPFPTSISQSWLPTSCPTRNREDSPPGKLISPKQNPPDIDLWESLANGCVLAHPGSHSSHRLFTLDSQIWTPDIWAKSLIWKRDQNKQTKVNWRK